MGEMVSQGNLRGEIPENCGDHSVLVIGLFDGISALRVALDLLGVQVLSHVSIDKHAPAQRVVESHYPGTIFVDNVELVDGEMVEQWRGKFSQCSIVLIGGGPPCQGVSGLNFDRKGALADQRSCLFKHVRRIRDLVRQRFPWCAVHHLMESVASMDQRDREIMSDDIGSQPLICDAGGFTWCRRPRLYWCSWDVPVQSMTIISGVSMRRGFQSCGLLAVSPCRDHVLQPGWTKVRPDLSFPTFTTSRPSLRPGRKPAGLHQCDDAERGRWMEDSHRFPPYQYRLDNCVVNSQNQVRVPDINERELMLGFPLNYTAGCAPKGQRKTLEYIDTRLSLLGNTWSVPVLACLLEPLFSTLGICQALTPQQVLDRCLPGTHESIQGRLMRLPLQRKRLGTGVDPHDLSRKLGNIISIKGEDIMLTTPTSQMCKFHRLRASVPGRLWRWAIITG